MSTTALHAITDETHVIRRLLGASKQIFGWRCACCGAREDLRLCDVRMRHGAALPAPCDTVICGRHSQHTAPDTDMCPFHRESES